MARPLAYVLAAVLLALLLGAVLVKLHVWADQERFTELVRAGMTRRAVEHAVGVPAITAGSGNASRLLSRMRRPHRRRGIADAPPATFAEVALYTQGDDFGWFVFYAKDGRVTRVVRSALEDSRSWSR